MDATDLASKHTVFPSRGHVSPSVSRGKPNELGLAFYDRLIDAILAADIEPWLCLYHWDLPQALDDLGGWSNRDIVEWFGDYAALVATRYGDRVKRFATFNESSTFTLFGVGFGGKPATSSVDALHRSIHHINLAHGRAVDVLRAQIPQSSIGVIHNCQPCLPSTETPPRPRSDATRIGIRHFPTRNISENIPRACRPTLIATCRRATSAADRHQSLQPCIRQSRP